MLSKQHSLAGKVALITGGGTGIGAATARLFAGSGAQVVIAGRTPESLERVAQSISTDGGRALAVKADVSREEDVRALFERARSSFGAVDILVNNAAITRISNFAELSASDWDQVMAINVRGPFLCCREAFSQMKESGRGGSIINISSLAGIRGTEKFPCLSSYVTSKFAIVGLTESLAVEGRAHGIRVNCVAPGAVDTEMLRKAAPHLKTRTLPDDIAKTLLFLADSSQSGPVSGAVLEIFSNL